MTTRHRAVSEAPGIRCYSLEFTINCAPACRASTDSAMLTRRPNSDRGGANGWTSRSGARKDQAAQPPFISMRNADVRDWIAGVCIVDCDDGVEGWILRSVGPVVFSALMDDGTVRYYCRGSDRFAPLRQNGRSTPT